MKVYSCCSQKAGLCQYIQCNIIQMSHKVSKTVEKNPSQLTSEPSVTASSGWVCSIRQSTNDVYTHRDTNYRTNNSLKQQIWPNAHKMRESLQQFWFSSLAENWGVQAKLIYKYQILYLDRITIILWRHLVNERKTCVAAQNRQKNP